MRWSTGSCGASSRRSPQRLAIRCRCPTGPTAWRHRAARCRSRGVALSTGGAGLQFLLSGQDTIGVVSVNPDPRESDLTRATDRAVTSLWKESRVVSLDDGGLPRSPRHREEIAGPFLWLALGLSSSRARSLLACAGAWCAWKRVSLPGGVKA